MTDSKSPKSPSGGISDIKLGDFLVYSTNNSFPPATPNAKDAQEGDQYVAFLFGWVGSSPRHLRKYADMLLALGVTTVYTTTAPTSTVFAVPPTGLRNLASQTLDIIESKHQSAPILLYYFSNGGAFIHEQLIDIWSKKKKMVAQAEKSGSSPSSTRIAATIFDSTPTYLSLRSGSMAVTEGIRNPILRWLGFVTIYLFMALIYVPFICGLKRPEQYFKHMEDDPLPCPSLYIYSSTDTLTDAPKLTALINARRKKVVVEEGETRIQSLYLTQPSPHVGHLLKHPEKYTEAVKNVLRAGRAKL